MRRKRSTRTRVLILALLALSATCQYSTAQTPVGSNPLAGRWDLTLTTPEGQLPSWIDVSFPGGIPRVLFVGAMDHAVPPKGLKINGSEFEFASPKDEEGFPQTMLFQGKVVNDTLVGTVTGNAGAKWTFTGVRAPSLDHKGTPQWGPPVKLFNGVDLSGVDAPRSKKNRLVEGGKRSAHRCRPRLRPNNGREVRRLQVACRVQEWQIYEQRSVSAWPL